MATAISFSMDCMSLWRDRIINPWKHNRIFYTDAELDAVIDRIFSLYCTISPLENTVKMQIYNYQRLLEACDIYDEVLTPQKANMTFFVCGHIRSGERHET